jgi:hypothetical protein
MKLITLKAVYLTGHLAEDGSGLEIITLNVNEKEAWCSEEIGEIGVTAEMPKQVVPMAVALADLVGWKPRVQDWDNPKASNITDYIKEMENINPKFY